MKRIVLLALTFFFLFTSFAFTADFWASKNSNKYHYPSCKWAQRISKQNLIVFKTPEEAVNDLFFMILDKNRYFCESTFGDKMIIRRITNNE